MSIEISNGKAGYIVSEASASLNGITGANQVIVSAPGAGKQIWVVGYHLTVSASGTVAWEDSGGTSFTGPMPITTGIVLTPNGDKPVPLYKCATNTALQVDVVTATIYGNVQYIIVSV